jgi:protein-L-isoaspartate(D-aspartate) O-methyltransferase
MSEDWIFRRRRAKLVEHLRSRGIESPRVLAAIGSVPRHQFIEPALRPRAYEDEALPIGLKQTISQPFTVAYQTAMLDPAPEERILEIGTGSGYQAAVLCEMGVRVFSVERHKPLLERTDSLLRQLGYRVMTRHGDGTQGWPTFAPFDGILVTAGATDIPQPLLDQLREPSEGRRGGRMIIPVGDAEGQKMYLIRRTGPRSFEQESTHDFRFVPLISDSDE